MRMFKRLLQLSVLPLLFSLSSCGGGSGGSNPTPPPPPPPPSNQAPQFTSSQSVSVNENTSTSFYTATATDPDNNTLTFSLSNAGDGNLFGITGAGVLGFNNDPNFEDPKDGNGDNVYDITLQVTDGTVTVTQNLTVTVINVNETPVFTSATTTSVDENTSGTFFTITAQDEENNPLSYSLIAGDDVGDFTLDPISGELSFVNPPDFENPDDADGNNVYNFTVQVSDGSLSDTQDITITVVDKFEPFSAKGLATINVEFLRMQRLGFIEINSEIHIVVASADRNINFEDIGRITLIPGSTISDSSTYVKLDQRGFSGFRQPAVTMDFRVMDFDGDGKDDLFAHIEPNDFGSAYETHIIPGTTLETLTPGLHLIEQLIDDNKGHSFDEASIEFKSVLDFNQDGIDDIAMKSGNSASSLATNPNSLAFNILLGHDLTGHPSRSSLGDFSQTGNLVRFSPEGIGSFHEPDIIGDIDDDGISEVLLHNNPQNGHPTDYAYILSGQKILDHPNRNDVILQAFALNDDLGIAFDFTVPPAPLNRQSTFLPGGTGTHFAQNQKDLLIGDANSQTTSIPEVNVINGAYVKDQLQNNLGGVIPAQDAIQNSPGLTITLPNDGLYRSINPLPDLDGDGKEEIMISAIPNMNKGINWIIFSPELDNLPSNNLDISDLLNSSTGLRINGGADDVLQFFPTSRDLDEDGVIDFVFISTIKDNLGNTLNATGYIVSGAELVRLKNMGEKILTIANFQ